jgi:phosphomannomutase/phosphoglucomutase
LAKSKPKTKSKSDGKGKAAPKPKQRQSGGGIAESWRRWRWPLILVVLLLGGSAGGMVAYQQYAASVEKQRQEDVQAAAQAAAADVGREVGRETQALANLFDAADLGALLAGDDADARAAREAAIAAAHEAVLMARLVPLGTRSPDPTTRPPIGYAAIDMMSESEKTGKAPPVEALLYGSDDQHILSIWRIDHGGALVGHLLLALDVSLLPNLMDRVNVREGYAELAQTSGGGKPLVLARSGDPTLRQGPGAVRVRVKDTPWRLAFWPGGSLAPPEALVDLPDWLIPAVGGGLVLIVVLVVLVRQRAQNRVAEAAEEAERQKQLDAAAKSATAKAAAVKDAAKSGDAASTDGVEEAYAGLDEGRAKAGIVVDEEAGAMDMPAEIFRAYDVRGIVEEGLTADVVRQIGGAIGAEAYDRGQQTIVVGGMGAIPAPSCRRP